MLFEKAIRAENFPVILVPVFFLGLGVVRLWQAKQVKHDLGPTRNIQRCPVSRYCKPWTGDADGDPNLVECRPHCWNRGGRRARPDGRNLDADGMPELVLPAHSYSEDTRVDSSYIISTTELTVLDTLDGKADYVIELDRTARHWSD